MTSDFEVLAGAVELRDRDVIDIGCGDGALVRRLAAAGANALGLEVSEDAVAIARRADPEQPDRYLLGGAESIPLPDAAVDVAVLMRSLHHVPEPYAALPELRRVVRGEVYIAEPLAEGAYFELMRPVDDETEVRAAAQAALTRAAEAGFEHMRTILYEVALRLDAFEDFRARVLAADPARADRFASVEPGLRKAFSPGTYTVQMRADLLC